MNIDKNMLTSQLYCTVATVDKDGQPWSTPVFFANKEECLYWFSSISSQHSQNIYSNSKVFITLFDSHAPEGQGEGLYMLCDAKEAAKDEIDAAIGIYNQKAQTFKIKKRDVSENAPTRLYRANIIRAWINTDKNENGYYEDIRKELSLGISK